MRSSTWKHGLPVDHGALLGAELAQVPLDDVELGAEGELFVGGVILELLALAGEEALVALLEAVEAVGPGAFAGEG